MRHIIVDGYNVIRADARLQSFERVSLEHARDVLVRTLSSSPRLANDDVLVVFDGRFGTRTHVHGQTRSGIRLLYSARGQTADDVIVQEARNLARSASVVVVTNDVEVREHCRAEGCEVSGSENLLTQLPGARNPARVSREEDVDYPSSISTEKRGNPRRSSRRERKRRDFRF